MSPTDKFSAALATLPLVAILRGLTPVEAPAVGAAITQAGFAVLEVPLNSPSPLDSIAHLAAAHPGALVGAGTVLTAQQVREVHAAGGQLIVSPHFSAEVVTEAVRLGLVALPGILTPTEAFGALAAGVRDCGLLPLTGKPPRGAGQRVGLALRPAGWRGDHSLAGPATVGRAE